MQHCAFNYTCFAKSVKLIGIFHWLTENGVSPAPPYLFGEKELEDGKNCIQVSVLSITFRAQGFFLQPMLNACNDFDRCAF